MLSHHLTTPRLMLPALPEGDSTRPADCETILALEDSCLDLTRADVKALTRIARAMRLARIDEDMAFLARAGHNIAIAADVGANPARIWGRPEREAA